MAGHTIKTSAGYTVRETKIMGAIWGKMYIKLSINITTLIAWTDQLVKYFIIEPPVHKY